MTVNETTPKFMALDWFESQLGRVVTVRNDRERETFNDLIGHDVVVDGWIFRCLGVDRFAHSPPWREGEPIGLLVKESP